MTDRLEQFQQHIQRKLEDDIQRVGELVQFAKLNPEDCDWTKQEMDDLDKSIPELRATLDQIRCFELEAFQILGKVGE